MIKRFGVSLWRRLAPDSGNTKAWLFVAGLVLGPAVIAVMDSWRTAVAATIAAGVLLATRLRFAPVAALILLALITTAVVGGAAPGHDEQTAAWHQRTPAHRHAPASGRRPSSGATHGRRHTHRRRHG